jgi:serine phosphatase RsbU (regulator of sigma subunit)
MFPSTTYEINKVKLNVGDLAFLFTDGIPDSRNKNNEDFTEEKLIKLVQKSSKLSSQKLLDKICKELDSFVSGADQMDDMTIVVIKRVS